MRAVVWHGKRDVRVDTVPDPVISDPQDIIIKVTSSGICGSDLHLYEVLAPFMTEGDILGHEPMGIVEEVGSAISHLRRGDRVVVPFTISCGHCHFCVRNLMSQCETTQAHEHGTGAALFGYTKLYGSVPGGQAEYLRVPQAHFGPVKVPHGPPDDRFIYLADVLPTAWQAVDYAHIPENGSLVVLGLGPIGDMCCRVALHRGVRQVIGVDLVRERLDRAAGLGIPTLDVSEHDEPAAILRGLTDGRGPDSVIDAVGMEAHGAPGIRVAQQLTALLPDRIAEPLMRKAGTDRLAALLLAIDVVRRGGTISLSGVYSGMADPLPMMQMFDKQIRLRMGQANVRAYTDELMSRYAGDDDPLGLDGFATHRMALADAPEAYAAFQEKRDGVVKVLLQP